MFNKIKFVPLNPHWWKDPIFIASIAGAFVAHAVLLSLQFAMPEEGQMQSQEIAVSLRPTTEKIKEADFLAQTNQQGSGKYQDVHRMSSDMQTAMLEQSQGEQQLEALEKIQQERALTFEEKVLMTTLSWQKQANDQRRKKEMEQLESQFAAKAAMVASLEAQYLQRQQHFSRQQKIKTVDGIQAKQDISAAYLEKFRQKVEFYGNRYYPAQASEQGLAGDVRLMVILNPNGGIRAIRLLESSGHPILDEAAKASVRKAAPFGQFSREMNDISELRIVRTWRFKPAQTEFEVK